MIRSGFCVTRGKEENLRSFARRGSVSFPTTSTFMADAFLLCRGEDLNLRSPFRRRFYRPFHLTTLAPLRIASLLYHRGYEFSKGCFFLKCLEFVFCNLGVRTLVVVGKICLEHFFGALFFIQIFSVEHAKGKVRFFIVRSYGNSLFELGFRLGILFCRNIHHAKIVARVRKPWVSEDCLFQLFLCLRQVSLTQVSFAKYCMGNSIFWFKGQHLLVFHDRE